MHLAGTEVWGAESAEYYACRGAGAVQGWCRGGAGAVQGRCRGGAGAVQGRCRGAWVQRCMGAEVRGCRGAWVQRCMGAEVRGCRPAWREIGVRSPSSRRRTPDRSPRAAWAERTETAAPPLERARAGGGAARYPLCTKPRPLGRSSRVRRGPQVAKAPGEPAAAPRREPAGFPTGCRDPCVLRCASTAATSSSLVPCGTTWKLHSSPPLPLPLPLPSHMSSPTAWATAPPSDAAAAVQVGAVCPCSAVQRESAAASWRLI